MLVDKGEKMIEPDKYWIAVGHKIDDISNAQDVITFDWSGNRSDDYIKLSESFYNASQVIITEIIDNYRDNAKCDQWFFPALYLYRQAIELLCKGLLITVVPRKDITAKFTAYKHNIIDLFSEYWNLSSNKPISNDELSWVCSYLTELETIDRESNLFRYPIKDGYLNQYKDDFLDIVDMANSIDQCYSIIYKCVDVKHIPLKYSDDIDLSLKPKVLFFASHGFGNCMLYTSPWDEGYYPHIQGYSNIAFFLLEKLDKNHWSFLTIAFLIRHAIELALKCMLLSRTETNVSEKVQRSKRRSHILYKDLWKSVKDMIEYYAKSMGYDLNVVYCADTYLSELSALDKQGDKFRYPTNYGLEYHLQLKRIDYYQAIYWLIGIFNFVNGCSDMLDAAYEYECDMRSQYL
ncbi:MAG: hypothetical protein PUC52_03065 [bacterium]|nr:hypothetical protein [bacterium]